MLEVLWHRRETRRLTEKTNINLYIGKTGLHDSNRGRYMIAYRTVLIVCFALFLSSCMAKPVLTVKNADMSVALKQSASIVLSVAVSPDGRYAFTSSMDDTATLWDIAAGTAVKKITESSLCRNQTDHQFLKVAFSSDGRYAVTNGKGLTLWNIAAGREERKIGSHSVSVMTFSLDGRYVFTAGFCHAPFFAGPFAKPDMHMILWDVETGREITAMKPLMWGRASALALSPNSQYALSAYTSNSNISLWNAQTGQLIKKVKANVSAVFPLHSEVRSVAFSPDARYALSGGNDNIVRLWSIPTLTEVKSFKGHTGMAGIQSIAFSPDGRYAISGGGDGLIKIWDISTGAEIKSFSAHSNGIASLAVSRDGKRVITAGDASTRIWDIVTGEEIATMVSFPNDEWIITTPNGYYTASPGGEQYLKVKVGGQDYSVEQLRESFYRPDLVKLALSGGSLKELKKVADVKPPPVVAIVDTPKSIDKSDAAITLKITDAGGGIGDIRLYLNGSAVMLDSTRGVKVVASNQNEIHKTYKLKLSSGLNSIRAIAFNADNTMQSTDAVHEITAAFKAIGRPSLYALVIGINEYKNPKLQLNYAVADAALFANTLKKGASPLFEKVEVKKLSSKEETTRENILKELKAMQSLNPDDLFVLYVASHGTVDDGEYFLITSNVGSTRTERLKTDAIGQKVFKELIGNIPATKKLIIIDTCNAGALGEAIQVAMLTRGMSEDTAMKILSRAVGSTILSAATSMQEALEGYQGHGLFTYVLSEGLKGKADKGNTGYVRTTELADYVDNEVPTLAEKIFKKAQYPTISISGQAFPIGKVR